MDPYLIHWSAYAKLMDRSSSAFLAQELPRGYLRETAHVGVSRFRCSFRAPIDVGARVRVRSTPYRMAPDRFLLQHTVQDASEEVAVGVTEHHATPRRGDAHVTLPFEVEPIGNEDGLPNASVPGRGGLGDGVVFSRRVHLRQVDTLKMHWLSWIEWIDEGTCLLLASRGHPVSRLYDDGIGFPLIQAEGAICADIRLDDEVVVSAAVERLGRTSLDQLHVARRGDQVVAWARTSHVCVDRLRFVAVEVPAWLH